MYDYQNNFPVKIERNEGYRKGPHISLVRVIKDDGSIYEFGIAAYNVKQKEVTFNINGKEEDALFSRVTSYDSDKDPSLDNDKGVSHFYTSTGHQPMLTLIYLQRFTHPITLIGRTMDQPAMILETIHDFISVH